MACFVDYVSMLSHVASFARRVVAGGRSGLVGVSLEEVRAISKASASCGSCTGLVESLLALTLGDDVQAGARTLCKCTSFTHDDARRLIFFDALGDVTDDRSVPGVVELVVAAGDANSEVVR